MCSRAVNDDDDDDNNRYFENKINVCLKHIL
jgi:hypothetical protein